MSAHPPVTARSTVSGHTLVEVLTAVAVLALMLLLIFQVIEGIFNATHSQSQAIEAVSSGRRILDVMTADLENAVINNDATVIAPSGTNTNMLFALLANRRGATGQSSRFLSVSYSLDGSNQAIRSYGSVGYASNDLLSAAVSTPVPSRVPLARNVLAIRALAVTDSTNYPFSGPVVANWAVTGSYNGHPVPSGYNALMAEAEGFVTGLTNCTRAVEVWVAVTDEQTCSLLRSNGKLAALIASLGSDPSLWRTRLSSSLVPTDCRRAIRVMSKTISLP